MLHDPDTIAAIATPSGRGGVGIIRVSGSLVQTIAKTMLGRLPAPRQAEYHSMRDASGQVIDRGLVLFFSGPSSYTGEDVLELQAHGGPVILDLLLQQVLTQGARLARPGEFTERAFLNDKLDLAQAEAVADLIDASTAQAARSAQRALEGQFSKQIEALQQQLTQLRVYVESAIDFVDEDIEFLQAPQLQQQQSALFHHFDQLIQSTKQGQLLREGLTLVIAGKPNAGKSSLMNALAGRDTAIVTEIAGTTRDILREHIHLDGMPLHLIDTAGLRESDDPVEREGIRRAQQAMTQADRVLLIVDVTDNPASETEVDFLLPQSVPQTWVYNKIDLLDQSPHLTPADGNLPDRIYLSAKSGAGLDLLTDYLKQTVGFNGDQEDSFIARRRHLDALRRAQAFAESGAIQLQQHAPELFAEDLRQAQQALSEITGDFSSDDLLGEIFSHFCIGK